MHKFENSIEELQLKALREYNIKDPDSNFTYVLESLAYMCEVPMCNITAISNSEIHRIESVGSYIPKIVKCKTSFSQFTIERNEYYEAEDIDKDNNLADKLHVYDTIENVRFYAGCPITDTQGNNLGVLNLFDFKTRVLNEKQRYFIKLAAVRISEQFVQKRQQQMLHYFETMFIGSKDIIGIGNINGEILKINPAFSHLTGYSEDELLNTNASIFRPDGTFNEIINIQKRLSDGEVNLNITLPFVTKNNEIKRIEWVGTFEKSTRLIYFIGRDVTAFEEQSALLKNSEAKFRAFFENSQSIMCTHDLQGNFISVNNSAASMMAIPIKLFQGKNLIDFLPKSRRKFFDIYLKELKEKGVVKGNTETYGADGNIKQWLYNSIVEKNNYGETYVFANAVDLTDRYKMEEVLKIATKKAQEANLAKSQFIANISHDIRTPLNGVIGFADLMLKTQLDNTQKQYLKIINQSGVALLNIVDQVLDFSKISTRKVVLLEEKVDLKSLASDACYMVLYSLEKKGLEMLLDFDDLLPRFIWADQMRLKQVLVNLLSNAVKFTEVGEIRLSISLLEELPNNEVLLHFCVSDTGIGIHADNIDKIFQYFNQEDSSITKKYGGTGLGLTISNQLLELKGSKLEVKSELEKGSTFCFDLKMKSENDKSDVNQLKGINKVLVVDDNHSNRKILRRMLELKNIEVHDAESGLAALLKLQENTEYDVIIIDYHMPEMNGIETIIKIKEDIKTIKNLENQSIIMLHNSSDSKQFQLECDQLKIQARLIKPVKMHELYEVLEQLKNKYRENHKVKKVNVNNIELSKIYEEPLTVLIAEDNEINLYLTKILIKQLLPNSQIVEARDGVEAVELFFAKKVDFVLMDIQMPNMNGYEATKKIRMNERNIGIPIIALTAGNMSGEREKCLQAGMNDFMAKPIVREDLRMLLNKWIKTNQCHESESLYEKTNVEHINKILFRQYSTDDSDFKGEFIQLAKKGIQENTMLLQKALLAQDLGGINSAGHILKGTCLAVGLTQLSKLAIVFELLEDFDEQYAKELFEALLFEINIVDGLLDNE